MDNEISKAGQVMIALYKRIPQKIPLHKVAADVGLTTSATSKVICNLESRGHILKEKQEGVAGYRYYITEEIYWDYVERLGLSPVLTIKPLNTRASAVSKLLYLKRIFESNTIFGKSFVLKSVIEDYEAALTELDEPDEDKPK